ncbi:aminotransferase class V-fold PLP-dependent enzyme [Rhodococcus aerolatus]
MTTSLAPARPHPTTGPAVAPFAALVGAGLPTPTRRGDRPYVNLDNAASTPALAAVADEVTRFLPQYASVHRGAGHLSQVCTRAHEQARRDVAAAVGAGERDVVVFTRNTTDALNLLATAVPGRVVYLDVEHHANFLPWQESGDTLVPVARTVAGTLAAVEAALRREPVALLTVTGASNVTGEVLPLAELAALAHRHGARIAVDGAQLVPHRRIDLTALGLDYLAFSGHKLYAPFGAGVLVGRRDWLDAAPPHLAGGGAVAEVTTTGTTWAPAPARHEGGTPNLLGVLALAAACRELTAWDEAAWHEHERVLHAHVLDELASAGLAPLRIWADPADVVGVVAFTVPGWRPAAVAAYLADEHGIGVRDGRFCAHPLLARLGVPGGAVRVSLGVGSSSADVDRLGAALRELVALDPAAAPQVTETPCGS